MVNLWEKEVPNFDETIGQNVPNITPYIIVGKSNLPAIIVCPGGGYSRKAEHEGGPVAKWLNSIGINAFVLDYRVAPYTHPCAMYDVKRAIRYVRYNAKQYNVNPHKIGVLGFSAGGHLAATASTYFDYGVNNSDEIDKVSSRPDISVLCYPVISFEKFLHIGSRINLLGDNSSAQLAKEMSIENCVKKDTPPTFIWHTAEDKSVPVQNAMLYANALSLNNIEFELHIFPKGRHGLGIKDEVPYVRKWMELFQQWATEQKFI